MSTGESLLEAIVADPDDDDLRLVYADWLVTRNDPRGELLQLSCQLGRAPAAERPALALRIADLERRCAAALAALGVRAGSFTFDRGFVCAMAGHVPVATTVAELADREPLLDSLDLTVDGQRDRVQLARPTTNALLARARVLGFRGLRAGNTRAGRGPIADLGGLVATPFTHLRALDLRQLRIDPEHVVELLRAMESVPTLERLQIATRMPADELARVQPAVERLRAAHPSLVLMIA